LKKRANVRISKVDGEYVSERFAIAFVIDVISLSFSIIAPIVLWGSIPSIVFFIRPPLERYRFSRESCTAAVPALIGKAASEYMMRWARWIAAYTSTECNTLDNVFVDVIVREEVLLVVVVSFEFFFFISFRIIRRSIGRSDDMRKSSLTWTTPSDPISRSNNSVNVPAATSTSVNVVVPYSDDTDAGRIKDL
jgi:hypothetical protein